MVFALLVLALCSLPSLTPLLGHLAAGMAPWRWLACLDVAFRGMFLTEYWGYGNLDVYIALPRN